MRNALSTCSFRARLQRRLLPWARFARIFSNQRFWRTHKFWTTSFTTLSNRHNFRNRPTRPTNGRSSLLHAPTSISDLIEKEATGRSVFLVLEAEAVYKSSSSPKSEKANKLEGCRLFACRVPWLCSCSWSKLSPLPTACTLAKPTRMNFARNRSQPSAPRLSQALQSRSPQVRHPRPNLP